jgi:hypothetical protein
MSGQVRPLFIVRLWLPIRSGDASHGAQWRGSVEHTLSGQRRYFTALADLVDFITVHRGEPSS